MQRPPYRDFYYPLNVFLHILTLEGQRVSDLHYGLFRDPSDSFVKAQTRSTDLLMESLPPPPPARLLDVGCGLGSTLARLIDAGYDAEGLNPDPEQVAGLRALHGDRLQVRIGRFEELGAGEGANRYDAVLFQESSQYIESEALFRTAEAITSNIVVLDEFAVEPLPHEGALHDLPGFLRAAGSRGFQLTHNLDVSSEAMPTVDYFLSRFSRYRNALIADLGLTAQQIDDLVASGERYKSFYENGTYQYRLLLFER